MTLAESLEILNLTETASVEDIKEAYRERMRALPGAGTSDPIAEREFERIVEAYQFLLSWKLNAASNEEEDDADSSKTHVFTDGQIQLYTTLNILLFGLIPLFLIVIFEEMGVVYALALNALAFPYTRWYFKKVAPNFFANMVPNAKAFLKDYRFYRLLILAINLYLYNHFALRILLPMSVLLGGFVGLTILPHLLLRQFKSLAYSSWVSMVIIPTAINLFVLSNFAFTTSETKETLTYYNKTEEIHSRRGGGGREASPVIEFHNGKYQDYWGMRFYTDRKETLKNNLVTLTFKTSYCGLTVVSDYEFFYDPRLSRTASHYR